MSKLHIICLSFLLLIAVAASLQAGTFVMQNASAVTVEETAGYVAVEVRASASYEGTVDAGDDNWQINTLLNHNRDGDSLSNWSAPDAEGAGKTGFSITSGMVVQCATQPCAAYANLYRNICPSTYNYVGRGAVAIYHQFSPEIDTLDTHTYLVGCYESEDGGGLDDPDVCGSGTSTFSTTSSIESGELLARGSGGYSLERQDTQGQTRFLLEEWAVASLVPRAGATPEVEVIDASSPRFAGAAAAKLMAQPAPVAAGTVLLVEGVDHPRNGRQIPLPEVELHAEPLQADSQAQDLVVRVDFSEVGGLVDLRVLYSDQSVSNELLAGLRDGLRISYADTGRHRAIAFVTFDLDGMVTVRSSQVVLPQCCCYTDETGVWCA